jgi:glycosyltransferase involved in cell wall biosynthesis
MNPKISVIVPVYNVAVYLEKCVNSILNQTLNEFELILIDDGSTDKSGIMCDDFALLDSRIKVVHKKNGGLSDARNSGLAISTSDFVMFVDSDDWIEEDMLAYLYSLIIISGSDIAQCGFTKVYKDEVIDVKTKEITTVTYTDTEKILRNFFLGEDISSVMWDKIYSRNIIKDLRFPIGQTLEDHYLLSDIFVRTKSITLSTAVKYYYLQRDNSIMKKERSLKHMTSSFLAYKNRIKVSENFKSDYLVSLSLKGLASDFFQYYRLIYLLNSKSDSVDMYRELKKEHKQYKRQILKNKMISPKFKLMLELCYVNPKFISFLTK